MSPSTFATLWINQVYGETSSTQEQTAVDGNFELLKQAEERLLMLRNYITALQAMVAEHNETIEIPPAQFYHLLQNVMDNTEHILHCLNKAKNL